MENRKSVEYIYCSRILRNIIIDKRIHDGSLQQIIKLERKLERMIDLKQ